MILCSAFLFASLAATFAAKFSWFCLRWPVARADYGKFPLWSNRNLKKMAWPVNKTLRPASGFGFILLCGDSCKPSRPS